MTETGAPAVLEALSEEDRIKRAFAEAPAFYANSFINMIGSADICTVFERNAAPAFVLNMSYTTAKTYALLLGRAIAQLEENTGREIMTTDLIAAGMGHTPGTVQ